jgi:transcriptional regulator with XRE-family HTH domain
MTPFSRFTKLLLGELPFPAGAVPLSMSGAGTACCLLANGRWGVWTEGMPLTDPEASQQQIQIAVLNALVRGLGGSAKLMALRIGVSKRTVESWRSGRSPLPIEMAYKIALLLVYFEDIAIEYPPSPVVCPLRVLHKPPPTSGRESPFSEAASASAAALAGE